MKVIIAETAGFCFGVKRVVDLALDSTSGKQEGILTLGPVIHNTQTIEMLSERGAKVIHSPTEVSAGDTVLVRAHGITPQVESEIRARAETVIDGTCPKVKTVHRVISRFRAEGYEIVITGDEGHAEVVALLGYADGHGHLISTVEDVPNLENFQKICLVSQTTFDRNLFDQIAHALQQRFGARDLIIRKTICGATNKRQEETKLLAQRVDALIVVGGKHSANTLRLAAIAGDNCPIVMLVETELEIDQNALRNCQTVGITAGASTPNWMIRRVADYVQYLGSSVHPRPFAWFKHALENAISLNVAVSLGAVAMYAVACFLQGRALRLDGAIISFLYFFSMYLWNSLASIELTQHHGIGRYTIYHTHKRLLYGLAIGGIMLMLATVYRDGPLAFYVLLFSALAGTAYHLSIVPPIVKKIVHYGNLKDIPTSRDLFVALAWATVLTFLPISQGFAVDISTLLCFGWIFVLAYLRSVIFDLRDIEGDRIMGRETLVTIVGELRIRKAILVLLPVAFLGLIIYPCILLFGRQGIPNRGFVFITQIPVLVYIYYFLKLNQRISFRRNFVFVLLADGLFYLSGCLSLVTALLLKSL